MSQQTLLVKITIAFMVLVMIVGIAALIITPLVGGDSGHTSFTERANGECTDRGGVRSIDGRSGSVVCEDGNAYDVPGN